MEIVAGFLNSEITDSCGCKEPYRLPFKQGEYFDVIVKNRENPAILDGFSWEVIDEQGAFEVIRFTPISGDVEGSITFGAINTLEALCEAPSIQALCGDPLETFCGQVFDLGISCMYEATCFDKLLEYEMQMSWGWVSLRQRLPIYLTKMQPVTNNVKQYQGTDGVNQRIGRVQTYWEHILKIDFQTDLFHKMLVKILTQGRNLKIDGKSVSYNSGYEIGEVPDTYCKRPATCKIIENEGLSITC